MIQYQEGEGRAVCLFCARCINGLNAVIDMTRTKQLTAALPPMRADLN